MSSWLGSLVNGLGSVFGADTLGDDIAQYIDPSDLVSNGGVSDSGVSMWPSIIGAGAQLAGGYFNQANSKDTAEQYATAQAAQIAAEKEMDEKRLANAKDIASIYAGASSGAARKSTLASLYNNWANLTAQGGANQAQAAIGTGKGITDGINARASVLR